MEQDLATLERALQELGILQPDSAAN